VGFFNEFAKKDQIVLRTNAKIVVPDKEGVFNVKYGMVRVPDHDEVWRRVIIGQPPSYVRERTDQAGAALRRIKRAEANSRLTPGYACIVKRAVLRCERPDGRAFQGMLVNGYVVTFDVESERRIRWDSDDETEYFTPIWDDGGVRVYAGPAPNEAMSLGHDHFGTWNGEDVSVILESGGHSISAGKKVCGKDGNLGYLRLALPPVALGAVCVTVSSHRIVGYVCAIGRQWCRIRFIGCRIAMVFPAIEYAMVEKPANCSKIVRSTSSRWGTYCE